MRPLKASRDRDNRFYRILRGGARMKLLEAFLALGAREAIGASRTGSVRAGCLITRLSLHPHRSWKFLQFLHALPLVWDPL